MIATKGNGLTAGNSQPAKKYTIHDADFMATISPTPAFFSPVSVNCGVSGVSGVSALIHKGFLLKPHDFSGVSGVSASAGSVSNHQFFVFIHTKKYEFAQILYEYIQSPRCARRAGAGAGQQIDGHVQPGNRRSRRAVARLCARIRSGAEKHHGFGDPVDKAQHPRPFGQRIFFFPTLRCAGRGFLFGDRVGTPARVCRILIPVRQPHTVCLLRLAMRAAGSPPVDKEPFMADPRTSAPASGTLGTTPAINNTADTRNKHAKATAYACGFLALLIFIVNAWLVIEGIQSTEPASDARYAHIAQSVLLALIEFALFAISGLFPEFKNSFRAIGILILTLEIGLMSISQISTGLTAGKVAARSEDVVAQLKAKADISLNQVKMAQETAKNLNGSKHGWRHEQAAQQTNLAAVQSKSAASDVEKLAKASTEGAAVSTPMIEIIGKTGLAVLSIALAFGLSISGIALTHCMGSLIRRSGAMPVDLQILELLHRIHGGPAAPVARTEIVAPVAPAPIPMAMQVQAAVAPAPALPVTDFKPARTVAPKDVSTGLNYSGKAMFAGAGALAAMAAPTVQAAPAVPAVSKPIHAAVSETIHAQSANMGSSDASNAAPVALEISPAGVSKPIHADVSKPIQQIVKKPRAKRAVSAKLDTGVEGKAGARFKRIRAGVLAGKIRPSVRGIQAVEGGSQEVVADYLHQLETEGVIIKAGRGYALASKGGAA